MFLYYTVQEPIPSREVQYVEPIHEELEDIDDCDEASDEDSDGDAYIDQVFDPNLEPDDYRNPHIRIADEAKEEHKNGDESEEEELGRTSVTGAALQHHFTNFLVRRKLSNIARSKYNYLAADRASNNVKAGREMTMGFISGILHGVSNMTGGTVKAMITPLLKRRGSGRTYRNPLFQRKIARTLLESRSFAKYTKRRGLNKHFNPSNKIVKEIRWNTLQNHLRPFTNRKNQKLVKKVKSYWIKKKKINTK